MTKLINLHHKDKYGNLPNFDIYIGRKGMGFDGYFGNPIEIKYCKNRNECIEKYKDYFYKRIESDLIFKERIISLKNKVLSCFCVPSPCHGMVIIEYLDGISIKDQLKAFHPDSVNIFEEL